MKNTLIRGLVCAAIATGSMQASLAKATPMLGGAMLHDITDDAASDPALTRVWWAGPNTVCHRGPYGPYCHPVYGPPYSGYGRPWIPGHYSWRGFWIPGHWA